MQKITSIEIKNFKSIRHAEVKDCRRINVFIGYPNVGKSNILEALSGLVYEHSDYPNFKNLCRYNNNREIFFNGNTKENAEITLNDSYFLSYYYYDSDRINIDLHDPRFKEIKNEAKGSKGIVIREAVNTFLFSVDSTGGSPRVRYYSENSGKGVVFNLKKYAFDKSMSNENKIRTSSLSIPFGENISDIILDNKEFKNEVISLFKVYDLSVSFDVGLNEIRVFKNLDEQNIFSLPLYLVADTLQRLIFYKAAIASNKDAVLLFEEPEAHMFPPYIAKFTTDILFDKNDNQYFIATHSPFVINEFIEELEPKELAVYVVDYDKGETIIKRLTDEEIHEVSQYGIDLFFNLEGYLDKYGQPHSA
ncbi:AAA family ATPase [Parasediminibacterium sp. JCM 36343]|uniref:AAA family ATPase n=1 Tax=Parasediminibacterium sp. JCM 36343 TaxID=3374279 RepID=UPI00397C75D6